MSLLYQQVVFIREKVLALKMAILHDLSEDDKFSMSLLNAHYLDSNGQLWLFISGALQYVEAFSRSRHIRLDFFAPEKNYHVEGTGIIVPLTEQECRMAEAEGEAAVSKTFIVKVDITHLEYYEIKMRKTGTALLSLLHYKWLNFIYRDQSSKLLVLRRA